MMLDQDVVAVSPATTYRVLSQAGRLDRWNRKPSKKGTGFHQPVRPHEHWHIDVSYLNLGGTFYYLCSVLDGASRAIVHWEIRESMKEREVECILERAKELYPDARPRIISDNGPQFIAKDFKEFIRISGMSHVRISPYYPQSNGKIERWHQTLKGVVRPAQPETLDQARHVVARFVDHYNRIGFTAPSVTSRRWTSWPAKRRPSGPSVIGSSKPHASCAASAGRSSRRPHDHPDPGRGPLPIARET